MKKLILLSISISVALFCSAQFRFNKTTGAITGYYGTAPAELIIPSDIKGVAVQTISVRAFLDNTDIKSVIIPNTVLSIEDYAFSGCSNLANLMLGSAVKSIGAGAFQTSQLAEVNIPNSVEMIGIGAFMNCKNLTSLILGNSIIEIGNAAFRNCRIENLVIPNSVTTIGTNAFQNNSCMKTLSIGSSLTTVGISPFAGCIGLTKITAYPTTPVDLTNNPLTFYQLNVATCTLYVLAKSVDAYKSANIWKKFVNIIGL